MPSEPLPPRPRASDRPSRSPPVTADKEADALRGFAHIVVDFTAQARAFLAPHVDVTDPTSVACFASKLAKHPISDDVGHLLSGRFKDLVNFANLFIPSTNDTTHHPQTPQNAPQPSSTTHHPRQPTSFLDALVTNLPPTPPRPHPQLPRLTPGQTAPNAKLQPETYRLSRRGSSSLQRAAVAACGHEEKTFATVKTAPNAPPLRHPANLRHVFLEGQAPGSHVVFPTHDPRTLLVCGPKSALPLLQTAYNHARDFTRSSGCMLLPEAQITPIQDPVSLPNTPRDRLSLLQSLRDEISRLDSPANDWRARRFYANTLAETEKKLYNVIKEHDASCDNDTISDLEPLERQSLVRHRTGGDAHLDDVDVADQERNMTDSDAEHEIHPPAKLTRHN